MASKRAQRRRACTGKVRHATAEGAGIALWKLKRYATARVNIYRCHHCKGWHVGRTPLRIIQFVNNK